MMPDRIKRIIASQRGSLSPEDGETIAKHGLVTVLIALAVVAAAHAMGTNLMALFTSAVNGL
jgi:Flp pilus assembly pilin Flp